MKILKKINVIDIEATCWDNPEERKDQPNEALEIGITEVDLFDLKINRSRSMYIIPQNSTISEFCTKLTGITPGQIAGAGVSFIRAVHTLKQTFRIHNRHWISWGDYDKDQLQRDCDRNNLVYKKIFFKRHINFKTVFAMLYGLPKELGVEAALTHIGLKFIGQLHSGKDDSYNIARLYIHTLEKFRKK
jgi:inhibitor of KinA sporulation pathway (predicted exonuclease)